MGSIRIHKGMPPLTDDQIKRLDALSNMSDDDIDCSDIPAPKPGEPRKWFRLNPRTPEEWEQFYQNCPPHKQKYFAKLREKFRSII